MKFSRSFTDFSCLSVIVLRICNAPVIYIPGAPRAGDSKDIARLKCRDLTSDESWQCLISLRTVRISKDLHESITFQLRIQKLCKFVTIRGSFCRSRIGGIMNKI